MRRLSIRHGILAMLSAAMAVTLFLLLTRAVAGHRAMRAEHDAMTREIALCVSHMMAQMFDVMASAAERLHPEVERFHASEAVPPTSGETIPDVAAVKVKVLARLPPGTDCDVAVVAPSGLTLATTYAPENGLDMSGFPDVVELLKRARETGRVQAEFPVQESTGEHMRLYTYATIAGSTNFLQLAFWTPRTQQAYRRMMEFLQGADSMARVSVYMLLESGGELAAPVPVFDMTKAAFGADLPEDKSRLIVQTARNGEPAVRRAAAGSRRVVEHFCVVPAVYGAFDLRMKTVVCVGVDETAYRLQVMGLIGLSALLAAVALVAWVLVWRLLSERLFAPLQLMTDRIRASAPVDLSGPAGRTEEFATIAGRYNEHLTRILQHQDDLQNAYLRAEQMVRDRTAELERTNRKLSDSESQLKQLSARLLTLQDDERQRIASDLHDSLGQSLCAVKMKLEALEASGEAARDAAFVRDLGACRRIADDMIAEIRQIVSRLRPLVLDLHGLKHALDWLHEQYAETPDVTVESRLEEVGEDVPPALQTAVFRIAQEAMSNAVRHSGARHIVLELGVREDGRLRLAVSDDGKGLDSSAADALSGRNFGLLTMRERARASGGELAIVSMPGNGTTIEVVWPLATPDA